MKIERLLQINIAALTVIGAFLLGLGQNNPLLPVLAVFAAVTSIYFTDILGWLRLHRLIANLAALGALFVSMREFDMFGGTSASQLRAIASLLVYLQFVLLYQEKSQRVYWQLAVLSLLQVVVAAALDLQVGLGLLLLAYMLAALSGMSLLFIYSQVETVRRDQRRAGDAARGLGAAWTPTAAPQTARQCSETLIQRALLGPPFLARLIGVGAATWVLAMAVFFSTPRLGNAVWRGPQQGGMRTVGFSREVRLGEIAEIVQNDALAMRLKLVDRAGDSVRLEEPLYLRGKSLSRYHFSDGEGRWFESQPMASWRASDLPPPAADHAPTTIAIWLEPTASPALFSVAPICQDPESSPSLRLDMLDEQLTRSDERLLSGLVDGYHYVVATTGIRNGRQERIWPRQAYVREAVRVRAWQELERLREWSPFRFPQTAKAAQEALAEADVSPEDAYRAALALEAYFLWPGRFTYSLDGGGVPPRPENVDPIEHFVANHRRGHCEYFASALAIMLRSQGIPARLVVGYRGGEFNSLGKYYLVRQRDAHAWVEAYLEREQVPEDVRRRFPPNAPGAWLVLDPTPAAPRSEPEGVLGHVSDAMSLAESAWSDYVLGLNSDRQRQAIYQPAVDRARSLAQVVKTAARSLSARIGWRRWARSVLAWFHVDPPGAAFPWRTASLMMVLGVSLLVLAVVAWRSPRARRMIRRLRVRRAAARPGAPVAFYRRLERLLARRRLRRLPHQTQREFIEHVLAQWGASPARGAAAPLLEQVVAAFYRVRFGGRPLDSDEAEAIEKTLDELELTLAKPHA